MQEQRRSRSTFRSDSNGTAGISSSLLGQRVRGSQGKRSSLGQIWTDSCAFSRNKLTPSCLSLQDLIRSMLEVEVDQRYTALQVLEHPWVTVSTTSLSYAFSCISPQKPINVVLFLPQNEGLCENEHQLSVAGKIKKHFNTGPKVSDTTAGVSVISVSITRKIK